MHRPGVRLTHHLKYHRPRRARKKAPSRQRVRDGAHATEADLRISELSLRKGGGGVSKLAMQQQSKQDAPSTTAAALAPCNSSQLLVAGSVTSPGRPFTEIDRGEVPVRRVLTSCGAG